MCGFISQFTELLKMLNKAIRVTQHSCITFVHVLNVYTVLVRRRVCFRSATQLLAPHTHYNTDFFNKLYSDYWTRNFQKSDAHRTFSPTTLSYTHTHSYEWKRERRSEITQRLTSLTEAMNENLWWGNTAKQETCGTPVQSQQKRYTHRRTRFTPPYYIRNNRNNNLNVLYLSIKQTIGLNYVK